MRSSFRNARLLAPILLVALLCGSSGAQFLPISAATPDDKSSVAQLIDRARASRERGDLDEERVSLERALALNPTHKQARLALTEAFMRLGRWKDAEGQTDVLMTQFPADTEPIFLRAIISMREGDPRTAKALATGCLERGDSRPEVYKLLARSEYLLHDNGRFETHIRAVIEKNPHDAEAQYFLARYLFDNKQYSESLKTFQLVLEIEPDHYKAHYYVGLLHIAAGEPGLARGDFLASIKVIENQKIAYAWPFADLGRALNDAGETGQVIDWISRGIRNDPTCPKAYYEYARALFQKGATAEVKQALLNAVRLDPGYTEAYYLLARYYRKSGETQTATQVLAKFKDLKNHPIASTYGLPRQ